MQELSERCLEICRRMRPWFQEQNYAGIDPYLLDERAFGLLQLPLVGMVVGKVRRLLKPLHPWIPRRVFTSLSPVIMPKALGLIVGGNSSLYRIDQEEDYLEENRRLLDLLIEHRSPGFQYLCWGQPFAWGSAPRYPPHTPAVCVTSPIAHGILDHYEVSRDQMALTLADSAANYLMAENGYKDFRNSLCLHYGPTNPNLTYNSNIMAASFLLRLSRITTSEAHRSFASKALRFVIEGQNPDGSWYYTDSRGGSRLNTMIDSRHSGFVLEHLKIAMDILKREDVGQAIERGWAYYTQALFDGRVPKWSPTQTYPVDIHDVAQAIITPVRMNKLDFAAEVVKFALDKFFDGNNQFYYKLFKDGRVNRTVFIRWGQAWMFRALSLFSQRVLVPA